MGALAKQLSERDLTDLQALLPADARPWLLIGYTTQTRDVIETYLQPETTSEELRRGKMVVFMRSPLRTPNPSSWIWMMNNSTETVDPADQPNRRSGDYVQVTLPGRSLNDVRDQHDPNRPFRVEGRLDDAELVSLVRFLQSSPGLPVNRFGPGAGNKTQLWPIEAVYRTPSEVIAWFHVKTYSSRRLHLRQTGRTWAITGGAALMH